MQLTVDQKDKIRHLQHAIWALEKATMHVEMALGDCDVSAEYVKVFGSMILELEDDITDVRDPAE